MIICETLLISIIGILGFYVTITDIKHGIIQNKRLLQAGTIGFFINVVYYFRFAYGFFQLYISNLIIMSILAVALYMIHFWAAGDSKLLIVLMFLFPARFYDFGKQVIAPGIYGFILIFLLAYVYVLGDTIIQKLKQAQKIQYRTINRQFIFVFIKSYIVSFVYLNLFSQVVRLIFKNFYFRNQVIFMIMNIFLVIWIQNIQWLKKIGLIIIAFAIDIILTVKYYVLGNIQWKSYIVLFLVLFLRHIMSGYNYQEIPTKDIEKGMVLSYITLAKFLPSRVKGLPKQGGEDMRYRITEDEMNAIKRWENSKYGEDTIIIVRKIPFAIFIVAGILLLFIIRILR